MASIGTTTLLFTTLAILFLNPIANLLEAAQHPEYVLMLILIISLDVLATLPFAYLQLSEAPVTLCLSQTIEYCPEYRL